MRAVAIIQARLDSSRLPGKVLRPILGRPMLWHVVQRTRSAKGLAEVVVATSREASEEPIRAFCNAEGTPCYAGSKNDVLDRYYHAACEHAAEAVVRITGDSALVDPELVTRVLQLFEAGDYDHFSIASGAGTEDMRHGRFPDGMDVECIRFDALARAWRDATAPEDREHVTPYIWKDAARFRLGTLLADGDYSNLRWTVDYEADFQLIEQIYAELFKEGQPFGMRDVLALLERRPELATHNRDLIGAKDYLTVDPRAKPDEKELESR